MPIIKLNATDSTNLYLKELTLTQSLEDYTIVSAKLQLNGRGQMGSKWHSEEGKNLTVSILKKFKNFPATKQFHLNCIVCLTIYDVLNELAVPNLSVKWPNDILSGNQKICGILVENILQGKFISKSILGIGLNVNQMNFSTLENASSIKQILGSNLDYDLDKLLSKITRRLKFNFDLSESVMREKYTTLLFRKDKPSTFSNPKGILFSGFIRGIDESGKLMVELENQMLMKYGLKEIQLLY